MEPELRERIESLDELLAIYCYLTPHWHAWVEREVGEMYLELLGCGEEVRARRGDAVHTAVGEEAILQLNEVGQCGRDGPVALTGLRR